MWMWSDLYWGAQEVTTELVVMVRWMLAYRTAAHIVLQHLAAANTCSRRSTGSAAADRHGATPAATVRSRSCTRVASASQIAALGLFVAWPMGDHSES